MDHSDANKKNVNKENLNRSQCSFIGLVATTCIRHGFSFTLADAERVVPNGGTEIDACSGVFDEDAQILAVGCGKPISEWFPVLVHEYCHLLQYIDGFYVGAEWNGVFTDFWDWLGERKELAREDVYASLQHIVRSEYDCEQRVLRLLRSNKNLGIDTKTYARRANAYLYFYWLAFMHRRWYAKTAPYCVPEILEHMQPRLCRTHSSYLRVLSPHYDRLVKEYVF